MYFEINCEYNTQWKIEINTQFYMRLLNEQYLQALAFASKSSILKLFKFSFTSIIPSKKSNYLISRTVHGK